VVTANVTKVIVKTKAKRKKDIAIGVFKKPFLEGL